jgi:hypothetical protein
MIDTITEKLFTQLSKEDKINFISEKNKFIQNCGLIGKRHYFEYIKNLYNKYKVLI